MRFRVTKKGYSVLNVLDRRNIVINEHVLAAEKAMGKEMPSGAVVHHVNENKLDNKNSNLVVCQDDNYHRLLHRRMRVKKECGNPPWRKCNICKKYDHPENLSISKTYVRHRKCHNASERSRTLPMSDRARSNLGRE